VRCPNLGQEVLFPDSLEAHLRLVGGSFLDLDRMNKHTCMTLVVAEDYSVKFVIRKTADGVCARREGLATDHKFERQFYNNLAPNLRVGNRTQPEKANECEQQARILLHDHDFSF